MRPLTRGGDLMQEDITGFYSLTQLSSRRETGSRQGRTGVFSWSKSMIRKLLKKGDFPEPSLHMYGQMMWRKDVIAAFQEDLMQKGKSA